MFLTCLRMCTLEFQEVEFPEVSCLRLRAPMNIIITFKMALMTMAGDVLTDLCKLSFRGLNSKTTPPLKCRLTWKFNRPSLRLEIKILLLLVHVNGIGAIELSFVLDKLLGVGCKIMNVRSGAELPEKCQEVGLAFRDTRNSCNDWSVQLFCRLIIYGLPWRNDLCCGGSVLAYTLLGVDYNDASGDCAFFILDPHYIGGEDLKKIVNSGWCGWKKIS
ncbi:hypothetical protein C5167_050232 [Papaver somniferum]|uniref:UFSP1/2/DUB catalytic domain-containing protein n=1 Tax=Papaver somniferum TaxID=3469 RepID=A0A4Y7KQS7_PAPSO|nr:hypothetical protein C5167_050232 [Papaver somniferum]